MSKSPDDPRGRSFGTVCWIASQRQRFILEHLPSTGRDSQRDRARDIALDRQREREGDSQRDRARDIDWDRQRERERETVRETGPET